MMAGRMVGIRDADLRICAIRLFARELECNDARDVCLKRENLELESCRPA